MMASLFSELFVQHGTLISGVFFVVFFGGSLVALALRSREPVRSAYVVCVLLLVLGSGLTGLQPIPIVNANEYSKVAPEEYEHYDLRVVDADGRELPYDPRAMRPAIQNEELAENIGRPDTGSAKTDVVYTPTERREVARFLLANAREYRQRVVAGGDLLGVLKFPPHHLRGHWTAEELADYSEFVAVRVYRVEVGFTDDGRQAVVQEEQLVYEYHQNGTETV